MVFKFTLWPVPRILVVCFFLLTSPASNGLAQTTAITVEKNDVELLFPYSISFSLSAHSQIRMVQVALIYGVESASCLDAQARQDMEKTGTSVSVSWDWDLSRSGNLPPGAVIWWQWEIKDQDGTVLLTDVQKKRIEDPHYTWKTLQDWPVTVYWAEGSESFGRKLLSIAVKSLDRLEKNAGLRVAEPIQIVVYPSAEDMQAALVSTTEWAGGVAFPEYRVTLMGIPTDSGDWAEDVIPHELAHLVTDMQIFNCQGGYLPTWLSEGLAQYAEGAVTPQAAQSVRTALDRDDMPPLTSLAAGFPANTRLANQAYDQSWMVVAYMIDAYGAEKMDALLANIKAGQAIDKALQAVYGLNTEGIDQDWRASLGYGEAPQPVYAVATATVVRTKVPTLALQSPAGQQAATVTATETAVIEATATRVQPTSTPVPATATVVPSPAAAPMPVRSGGMLLIGLGLAGLCVVGVGVLAIFIIVRFIKK